MTSNFSPPASVSHSVTFGEAAWVWCRVAALSFGGPTAQVAVMHRILVEEKKWISEQRFLHALNYCMLLPGPEAQQLATYIGWLLHGWRGGMVAGLLFVLPGFVTILALSLLYVQQFEGQAWIATGVTALFYGLKPAVAAVVIEAVQRIGKRVLKNKIMVLLAVLSFVAIFCFEVPFPYIIGSAGLIGFLGGRWAPKYFDVIKGHGKESKDEEGRAVDLVAAQKSRTLLQTFLTLLLWLAIWFLPLLLIAWIFGPSNVLVTEGTFFSRAAVVTFGGAYAVLPYISQQAVERYGWLTQPQMMDGLGMAESTPGPLIMVVQFVGFMGAYKNPGSFSAMEAGILGSIITVWVTFAPCFLYIFVGAPYVERLRGNRLLSSALSAVTAAVVGVVLNLAVQFGLALLFKDTGEVYKTLVSPFLVIRYYVPNLATLQIGNVVIFLFAASLLFVWKRSLPVTLAASVALGIILFYSGFH